MTDFFDALETRDTVLREAALLGALPAHVAHLQRATRAGAQDLAGIDAATIDSRAALAGLPVLRKHELLERQKAQRALDPFGGHSAVGWCGLPSDEEGQTGGRASGQRRRARRVFQSPGPIYEPEGPDADHWRMARAIHAAGFRAGDLAHIGFSYHLTPAGAMMESGAHAVGCTTFAGGIGNTELQLQAIADLRPQGYIGTPSLLKILVEKAAELHQPITSLNKALVGGEAFPPSLRDWLAERGITAYQSYATAEAGLIAYETPARQGLVLDEGVILEIVRPGTGQVLADGEVGEVVVTVLNADYPLLRFGTGDLSAVLPGACPSGRTNTRIKGWLGRADQTAKVRGMFVHPSQVAEIVRRHAGILRARLVIEGAMADDRMTLHVELPQTPEGLPAAVAGSIRDITKLRGEVIVCAPGSLPNDGKVIDDRRDYR